MWEKDKSYLQTSSKVLDSSNWKDGVAISSNGIDGGAADFMVVVGILNLIFRYVKCTMYSSNKIVV